MKSPNVIVVILLTAFPFLFTQAQINPTDSLALVDLYNDANGGSWSNNTNWLNQNVDTWFGITVSGDRVTGIDLSNDGGGGFGNNLNGEITASIGQLTALTMLDLTDNPGIGNAGIPAEAWNLTNLNHLALSVCELEGGIPPEIGNLTGLTILRLNDNFLSGEVPFELWSLTGLQDLSINNNQLFGSIPPEVGNLTSLVWLNLNDNELGGFIPDEIGLLSNLAILNVHNNFLFGGLPSSIGNLSALQEFRCWGNNLDGPLPVEIGNLTNLLFLEGFSNSFSGPIPAQFGNMTNLQYLDFRANQLSGDLPTELGQLSNLTNLLLGRNQLTGTIPISYGNLSNLSWLALGNNQLEGQIPSELGNLTGLWNLGLSNNGFVGAVPASFQNLVNLDRFNISSNQLEDLPDLSALVNTSLFNVSNNRFDFADLEPIAGLSGIDYSNQDPNGGVVEEINASVGASISLDPAVSGGSNQYVWNKDGQLLEGVTVPVLILDPFATEDGGNYSASVTNALVPGLTIESKAFSINPGPPSAAPTGLTATSGEGSVTLEWTDNSFNENAWEIQRNLFGSYSIVAVITKDTSTAPGATISQTIPAPGNATMLFRVAALNDAGKSAFSNEASVDVGLFPPFIQSFNANNCPGLDVTIRDGNVFSNDQTGGVTQFIVQRSLDSLTGFTTVATIPSTGNQGRPVYRDNDVIDNTTYYYRVAAQTGDGNATTDFSVAQPFTYGTCDLTPNPLEPANVIDAYAVTSSQALIRIFRNANYNVGDQIVIERAVASVGNFVQIVNIELTQRMLDENQGELTYVDGGLTVGVDYIYRAFTKNATETTSPQGEFFVTTEATDFEILNFSALNDIINSQGVSWADYDLDGYEDLFISTFISLGEEDLNFTNVLIRNENGTGVTDVSSLTGIDDGVLSRTGNWGDYNNDGLIDLYVADASSSFGDLLYFNNGDVTFTKAEPQFFNEFSNGIVGHNLGAAADVDNDGFLDIATFSINTKFDFIKLYRNNGDATFTSEILSDRQGLAWTGVWGDYDADGDMDLFVGTDSFSPNFLFQNDGTGQLSINNNTILDDDDLRSRGSSWADYDNDGDLDLYVAGSFGDFGELYQNDGQGDFVKVTAGSGLENANATRAVVWEDFDNDGDLDLYTAMAGNAFFFDNNGDGTFTENTGVIPRNQGFMTGGSAGDFNKDGKRDLIITSTGGGASPLLYINQSANANNYLDVKLAGTISNPTAIGARVRVRVGQTWQLRQIVNLTGANGQNSLIAHFGLGTATNVDSLVVEWPSGQLTSLSDIAPNQILNIVEDPVIETNSPPVAVSITTPFTYEPTDEITLQAIDPDGDELEYQITQVPVNGSLQPVSSLDSLFTFIPDPSLAVEQIYEDSIKFVATEAGGGLSSNEAIIRFNYFIPDGPHQIDTITFEQSTGDFVLVWDDNTLNDSYNVEITYIDNSDAQNVVERTLVSADLTLGELSVGGDSISYSFTASASTDPFIFSASVFFVNVTVTSPSGQSSNDGFTIDTSLSARVDTSEDGLFFAFSGRSSVPENESVNLRLMAVELGAFSLINSSITILTPPRNGEIGISQLVKQTADIFIWDLAYTSTADIGGLDSVQFEILHGERGTTATAWAQVEIFDVNDRPTIAPIDDQSMTEDGVLSVIVNVDDPEDQPTVSIEASNAAIATAFDGNVLTINAGGNFFGEVAISVTADDGTFTALETFTLTVEPENDPPVIRPLDAPFSVIEDNRLNVPVIADDPEQVNGLITFSASSDDPNIAVASFDRNLLAVSPAENATGSVVITIVADDGTGTATAISEPLTFTVTFTPVNDAPVVVNQLETQSLVEGQPAITIDLANHFLDPESGTDLIYSATGNDGLDITFAGSVATVSITSGFIGSEIVNFAASDGDLSSIMQTPFVVSAATPDIVVVNPLSDLTLAEDFAQQTIDVSSVFSAVNPITYSVTGGSLVDAIINANNELIITSLENVNGSEDLTVVASDGFNAQFETFTLEITAVNDVPDVEDVTFVLAENTANSTVLGKVAASDVDSESFTFALAAGNSSGAFALGATTGELSVNDASALNFEQTPSFDLTVTVTDIDGGSSNATVGVDLIDIDEQPIITTAELSIDESAIAGTVVGSVEVTNPISTPLTFSFVESSVEFAIDETTGEVTLLSSLDFETTPVFNLQVSVSNSDEAATGSLTISVIDVNEAPVVDDATFSISENSPDGTFVGIVTSTDPEQDVVSYSITAGNIDAAFAVGEETGIITVSNASALDFASIPVYNLTVAADDGTLSGTAQVTVNLISESENNAPVIEDQSFAISEDADEGDVVGSVAASDEDGDPITFSIVSGNRGNTFALESSSGELTVNDDDELDDDERFTLTVEASDGELAATAVVTIEVGDFGSDDDDDDDGVSDDDDDDGDEDDDDDDGDYRRFGRFKIYPIPAKRYLFIRFERRIRAKRLFINLVNLSGKHVETLYDGSADGQFAEQFRLPEVNTGLYLLRIEMDGKLETRSLFIKQ